MRFFFNIDRANEKNKKCVAYNKLKTSGNDPSISTAMKYAQYAKTRRSQHEICSEYLKNKTDKK